MPLCYRGAPCDDGDRWLIGTAAHSVLGKRWVYDGCGDTLTGTWGGRPDPLPLAYATLR